MDHAFQLERAPDGRAPQLRLSGVASPAACAALEAALSAAPLPADPSALELDLTDLDDPDGPGVARLVDLLRTAAQRRPLLVRGAPAMLAHTLYKAALLGERLRLIDPRPAPSAG